MAQQERDYEAVAGRLSPLGSRDERMQTVVEILWQALRDRGVSWVGFYLDEPRQSDDCRLVLGPHCDKPACSPIGLHGVCGQALRFGKTRIVADVRELGDEYIASDDRDRSEIAIPLIDESETCWGVLDLDSQEIGAFSENDEAGLTSVLKAAGLLH